MSKLESSHSDLKRAYISHLKVQGKTMSHNLILFYAVECGLKALITSSLYNKQPRKLSTETDKAILTHKINDLVSYLRLPASIGRCPPVLLNNGDSILHDKIHEAWRYGIKLDTNSEDEVLKWLLNLTKSITSKLHVI